MKKTVTGLLVVLVVALMGGFSHAAGPPVLLGHTLTAYSDGAVTATADYSIHVENRGDKALADLTLSVVPLPPLFARNATIDLGYFGPHEKRDVFVQVEIPVRLDAARVSSAPLFWAVTYLNAEGKVAEFAVSSKPGGDK